jgi:hypothetical protein
LRSCRTRAIAPFRTGVGLWVTFEGSQNNGWRLPPHADGHAVNLAPSEIVIRKLRGGGHLVVQRLQRLQSDEDNRRIDVTEHPKGRRGRVSDHAAEDRRAAPRSASRNARRISRCRPSEAHHLDAAALELPLEHTQLAVHLVQKSLELPPICEVANAEQAHAGGERLAARDELARGLHQFIISA